MRKEDLLFKKNETVKNLQWYVKDVITDEDLKYFSIPQLERLIDLIKRAETFREKCASFCSLSENEVVQKSTGRIAYFENSGEIREETAEECMQGGCSTRVYQLSEWQRKGVTKTVTPPLDKTLQSYFNIFQLNVPPDRNDSR